MPALNFGSPGYILPGSRPYGDYTNSPQPDRVGFIHSTKPTGSNNGEPVTEAQIRFDFRQGYLPHNSNRDYWEIPLDYHKMRRMRRDPTIALARDMAVAPIVAAEWGLEPTEKAKGDPTQERQKLLVQRYVEPYRTNLVRTAFFGEIDYGWRAYEKVFKLIEDPQLGQRVVHSRIKPLLNDNTWARYTRGGDFDGLLHNDLNGGGWIILDSRHSLFINFDDDGVGVYNEPRLLRAENAYDEWNRCNEVAKRFDSKVAGANWVIHYPEGKTKYNGVKTDNYIIADKIANQIQATGHIILPSKLLADAKSEIEELGGNEWRIELIESSKGSADFVSRLDYLDKLKVRALGILERTIMEGNYGTKAEAASHLNSQLLNMDLQHKDITQVVNVELVNQVTQINYGTVDTMRFVAQPLADDRAELLAALFQQFLANPELGDQISSSINIPEVLSIMKLPALTKEEIEKKGLNTLPGLFSFMTNPGKLTITQ